MFVVMSIQDFEVEPSPKNVIKFPFPITIERGKMIGFLPVYNTKEGALSDFPNSQVLEVREVAKV